MEGLTQIFVSLAVLALFAAAIWALRRRGVLGGAGIGISRRGQGRMERLERLNLSPQHSLHLVRVGDRELLVAVYSGGCSLLETGKAEERISNR